MVQEQRVLNYMQEFGGITSLEAFRDLGITRLSAKIFNLKKQGYVINSEMQQGENRYGEITHFKRYMLNEGKL